MKRDMDLVRAILLKIEESENGYAPRELSVEGHSKEEIGYHCHLIGEAGLANATAVGHLAAKSPQARLTSLTWQGHDFIEAARDDTRWNKAKTILKEKGASFSIELMKDLLTSLVRGAVGL